MKRLQVGDPAPPFDLPDQTGAKVSLADFHGKSAVVLFFYPADESPVCTAEACSFRDAYEDFVEAGAAVIGVSADSAESHRQFAAHHRLPFTLLSDAEGALREAFGVPKTMGLLPGRVTYVIDRQGVVRHIFSAQLAAERHVREALSIIRELGEG